MPKKPSNAAEFTVSEISLSLRKTIEENFGNVRVRGEISGYRGPHASGHAYFALKDDKARLEAVIWRGTMAGLKFRPEEGLEVIAGGRLSSYPGSSKYQLIIDSLEPSGAGALMALLEERKRRLAAEGLFDERRKKPLPFMPRIIGVITSPTGAVIRDIIHRVSDRFPLHILVWPVRVQGETAGAEVEAAIRGFNALPALAAETDMPASAAETDMQSSGIIPKPDLLIVARGGGSLEDLWGFNDEAVVRAAADSALPIISAVGHETDWTLLDYAADVRAPTPTGAAEMAVPVKAELEAAVADYQARLYHASRRMLAQKRQMFSGLVRAFPSPDRLLADARRRFDDAASRLKRALAQSCRQKRTIFDALARRAAPHLVTRLLAERERQFRQIGGRLATGFAQNTAQHKAKLAGLARLIKSLSHESILERGFALVQDAEGGLIRRAAAVHAGETLRLRFADGIADAVGVGAPAEGNDSSGGEIPPADSAAAKSAAPKAAERNTKKHERKSAAPAAAKKPQQGDLF